MQTFDAKKDFNAIRKKAEKKLSEQPARVEEISVYNAKHLAHELGTHQIELEMQNDELRRTQQELEATLSKYQELYDFAPVGYFTFDERGVIREVNLTGASILGIKRDLLIGESFYRFIDSNDQDTFYLHLKSIFMLKEKETWEIRLKRKDGSIFYAQMDNTSTGTGYCSSILSDITKRKSAEMKLQNLERKQAEETLRRSEEKYRQLFESMSEGFALIEMIRDESGKPVSFRLLEANPALERLTPVKRQDIIDKDVREVFTDVEYDWIDAFAHVAMTGEPMHIERFSKELNAWYEVYAYCPEPGKAALIYTNITSRKNTEEALRASEERLRTLMDTLPVAVIIAEDPSCKVITMNPAGLKMFGIQPGDDISASAPDSKRNGHRYYTQGRELKPEDLPMQLAVRENRIVEDIELEVRRPDGTNWTAMVSAVPLHNHEGDVTGSIAVTQNISARKQAEEHIRQLNDQLKDQVSELRAANKELEAFSYSVSHDLRAPLRHISGFVELLQQRLANHPDEITKRYAELILMASKKMHILINDLLSFSHLGRTEMRKRKVNLNALITDVVEGIQEELQNRMIRWEIDKLPEVLGDESLLRLVIVNLLSNAVKFTNIRREAEIKIGCKEDVDKFTCWVADNGVGFDMKYANRLFGVFQRLHPQNEYEGTGIGLANVQRIISRHGGRVWAEGAVERGASFYFTLPKHQGDMFWGNQRKVKRHLDQQTDITLVSDICTECPNMTESGIIKQIGRESPKLSRIGADPTTKLSKEKHVIKVLLIEDNQGDAELVSALATNIKDIKLDIRHVDRLSSALEFLENESFDLVLSDLGLSDSQGIETFIKIHTASPDVPIILLTGISDKELAATAVRSGAQDYMLKGEIDSSLLLKSIQYAIERHEMMMELRNNLLEIKKFEAERESILSMFAHDIKNAIVPSTWLLSRMLSGKSRIADEDMASIRDGLITAEHLLAEFIEFSRLQAKEYKPIWGTFDIKKVVLKQIEIAKLKAFEKNIQIDCTFSDDPFPILMADRAMMERVIANLLDNAVKYTHEGGFVDIRIEEMETKVLVQIRDSGLGIPEEHVPNIFNSFYRVPGNEKGSGLGLSIAKTIVKAHGGDIWVESIPGKGSTFSFTIPQVKL